VRTLTELTPECRFSALQSAVIAYLTDFKCKRTGKNRTKAQWKRDDTGIFACSEEFLGSDSAASTVVHEDHSVHDDASLVRAYQEYCVQAIDHDDDGVASQYMASCKDLYIWVKPDSWEQVQETPKALGASKRKGESSHPSFR